MAMRNERTEGRKSMPVFYSAAVGAHVLARLEAEDFIARPLAEKTVHRANRFAVVIEYRDLLTDVFQALRQRQDVFICLQLGKREHECDLAQEMSVVVGAMAPQRARAFRNPDVMVRQLTWAAGDRSNDAIADAWVDGANIQVQMCSGKNHVVSFAEYAAIKKISDGERGHFEIDKGGSYLHWPKADVHLAVDDIRYLREPEFREKEDKEALKRFKRIGSAIKKLREKAGLTQSDIPGFTQRHVSRVETGEQAPTLKFIDACAAASGMDRKSYLAQLEKLA